MTGETLLYILRRLLISTVTILGVLTLVFIFIRTVPGDPARNVLGDTAIEEDVLAFRSKHNLDSPLHVQYLLYMQAIFDGSLGYTYDAAENETRVSALILKNFPATLELALFSMLVALIIAVPFGMFAAYRRGRLVDRLSTILSLSGAAIPAFFLRPALH
ncbi:MAG: ABC transporter permease, partial [Deltaproteobacteria bacterium]|nr:ABC transporter permease [Deltaproteobacteria bacterium]